MASETIVDKARVRSKEVVDSYLLHQAHDVFESHSLIGTRTRTRVASSGIGRRNSSAAGYSNNNNNGEDILGDGSNSRTARASRGGARKTKKDKTKKSSQQGDPLPRMAASEVDMATLKKKQRKKLRKTQEEKLHKKKLAAAKNGKAKKSKKKKDKTGADGGYKTETSATSGTNSESDWDQETLGEVGLPLYYILSELRKIAPEGKCPKSCSAFDLHGVFDAWTDERKAAYGKDLIAAVRSQDIEQLRAWHLSGRTLQAANRFGESALHMACRRGFLDVVRFLTEEAGVNLWIRDDTGRTPLHDACWTPNPCFELVDFILSKEKDMLYVSDKRGHTPLDYARKDSWDAWIEHFREKDMTTLLPDRPQFYLNKKARPVEMLHGDNKILENVDDMIVQLAISTSADASVGGYSSEAHSLPTNATASEVESDMEGRKETGLAKKGPDETTTTTNNETNQFSQQSNTSTSRRRRALEQREKAMADADTDDENEKGGFVGSDPMPPRRHSSLDTARMSWRVVDVKVTHQAAVDDDDL